MPNLTQDHHFTMTVSDNWIRRSQEIWRDEQVKAKQKGWKNIFFSPTGWVGKIGEWAFYSVFNNMRPTTSHYHPANKDFVSEKTSLRYELKTKHTNSAFRDTFHADLNLRQYKKGKPHTDFYVFCSYQNNSPFIRLCGWIYYNQVENRSSQLLKKGDTYRGYEVKSAKYSIPYANLNSMHLIESHLKESMK